MSVWLNSQIWQYEGSNIITSVTFRIFTLENPGQAYGWTFRASKSAVRSKHAVCL